MIAAFVYLLSRSFVNRARARLKRLKQPKYLVGAIFGFLYLYLYFFQFLIFGSRRGTAGRYTMDESLLGLVGVFLLFIFVVSAWIFPHARAALTFSEAEVAFLFPAPVNRRTLIHFKLLRSQIAIFFTVLLLTLFTGRFLVDSHAWMRMLGWWVILSTLGLHFLGASFARTLLLDRGISNWFRRGVVLLALASLIVGTVVWGQRAFSPPQLDNMTDWQAWRDYASELAAAPPLSYVLWPFRLVIAPYLASTPLEFIKALGPALAIIALHYVWVIRSNVAFEEASLDVSRKYAEKIAAAREGRLTDIAPKKPQRVLFRLSPHGWTPVAFLWKNLINAQATFRARTLVLFLIPVFVGIGMVSSGRSGGLASIAAVVVMMFFIWSLLLGPQLVRCDLRHDLVAMDVLKLFPMRGWQVVCGEVLAPTLILSVVQWLLLGAAVALMSGMSNQLGVPRIPVPWVLAAAVIAPFWNTLALLIPNAAVLLFPGWFQTRADAPQGIEVTGQRLLLFFIQTLVIGVTVIPAGIAFLIGFLPLKLAIGAALAPLAGAVTAALVLAGEIVLGVWLVGKLFDRFDLAAEQGG